MLALFFDVQPKPGHMEHYFEHVARLKPVLARHRGLIFLDRYRPLDEPSALLSHQLWADAEAIAAWRADPEHKRSQAAGRTVHFDGYRIRVATQMLHLPDDDGAIDPCKGRFVVAAYGQAPATLPDARSYESVNHAGRFLTLAATPEAATAQDIARAAHGAGADAVRVFAVDRDYTLTDRAEAPG